MMRIGDFSKLSQTPVSTLRYYNEIGLLKPCEVDHFTGYRYYTYEQLPRLNRILALKELGFSLEDTARLLAENLPFAQVQTLVRRRRLELGEQVNSQHERIKQLDAWLKQIEKENHMTTYTLRNARIESDLPDIVRITNPYESTPVTIEMVRNWFQYAPPGRVQRRLVAADEHDVVICYGGYVHEADGPQGYFTVWVITDPDHRAMGIGSAVWDTLLQDLQQLDATQLGSDVLDNDPASLVFAQRRGFMIAEHNCNYRLDLKTFDETPYLPIIAALEKEGIHFCSLADFEDTPATRRSLYDLNVSYARENPGLLEPISFPVFEQFIIQAPWFRREGQLLAVDGDRWVGMCAISLSPDGLTARNQHTGVLTAYRSRKLATALKVLGAVYARKCGAEDLLTDNNLRNAPILKINRKMGYLPQPGKYTLVRMF